MLYCRCAYAQVVPDDVKNDVLTGLSESDEPFDAVPDLCEMAARNAPELAEIAASDSPCIIACHARAVKGLFRQVGHPLPEDATILNMRELPAETILERLEDL